MTLKGTLDTFDLRELLQMLAFNQKVGTLRLQTPHGRRSVYVDRGRCTFLVDDPDLSRAMARELRRRRIVRVETVEHALGRALADGRYIGDLLVEERCLEQADRERLHTDVVVDRLLDAQLTAVQDFEFHDGRALAADGHVAVPAAPLVPVEGLLLDLARSMDQWEQVARIVPHMGEVFEGTGMAVDLEEDGPVPPDLVRAVLAQLDGFRTVAALAQASDVSQFDAAQVMAAVVEQGGARPVATEQLLERSALQVEAGAAEGALPLLRLALERGDAAPRTRFQLAEVLHGLGEHEEAAEVLDAFIRLHGGADVEGGMDALARLVALRGNHPGPARRLCDHYLQHRVELRARRSEAKDALGIVIRHADGEVGAREAAQRLAAFIEHGDAPSDDLRLLADLYARGGIPHKAGQALAQRAEDLLAAGRVAPARELLRKALHYDATCSGARRRLTEIDIQRRSRQQRARLRLGVLALVLAVAAVGTLWWNDRRQTQGAVGEAERHAAKAAASVEAEALALAAGFSELRERVRRGEAGPEDVRATAADHIAALTTLVQRPGPDLEAFAAEIERMPSGEIESEQRARLAELELRLEHVVGAGKARVGALLDQARDAYELGLSSVRQRRLRAARSEFRLAYAFAYSDAGVAENAERQLTHIEELLAQADQAIQRVEAARLLGREAEAYRLAVEGLTSLIGTGLESEMRFGAVVRSTPTGAQVLLDGEDTGLVTPCTVTWDPTRTHPMLELRRTAHTIARFELPNLLWIQTEDPRVATWDPVLEATLSRGPMWRNTALADVRDIWVEDDGVLVLRSDGRRVHGVDLATGDPLPGTTATADADGMEQGGRLPGGSAWRIQRSRRLRVAPPYVAAWEFDVAAGLDHGPAASDGVLMIVDSAGNAYGLDALTGDRRWRVDLESGPSHAPYASGLGFVVGTLGGAAFAIEPATGAARPLLRSTTGPVLALPFGTGVALLEHGPRGLRVAHADGRVEVRGAAAPRLRPHPHVGQEGVLWMEADGAVLAHPRTTARLSIPALGATTRHWAVEGETLFAVDARGRLQAFDLTNDAALLFEVELGAPPMARPAVTRERVVVAVEGALVAVQR